MFWREPATRGTHAHHQMEEHSQAEGERIAPSSARPPSERARLHALPATIATATATATATGTGTATAIATATATAIPMPTSGAFSSTPGGSAHRYTPPSASLSSLTDPTLTQPPPRWPLLSNPDPIAQRLVLLRQLAGAAATSVQDHLSVVRQRRTLLQHFQPQLRASTTSSTSFSPTSASTMPSFRIPTNHPSTVVGAPSPVALTDAPASEELRPSKRARSTAEVPPRQWSTSMTPSPALAGAGSINHAPLAHSAHALPPAPAFDIPDLDAELEEEEGARRRAQQQQQQQQQQQRVGRQPAAARTRHKRTPARKKPPPASMSTARARSGEAETHAAAAAPLSPENNDSERSGGDAQLDTQLGGFPAVDLTQTELSHAELQAAAAASGNPIPVGYECLTSELWEDPSLIPEVHAHHFPPPFKVTTVARPGPLFHVREFRDHLLTTLYDTELPPESLPPAGEPGEFVRRGVLFW
jgi:hypothetical protein